MRIHRKTLDLLGIWRMYLFQGHSRWTGFFMSLFSFSVITYNLFLVSLFGIEESISNYLFWIIIFLSCYIPFATVLGYYDMRKGTFRAAQRKWREIDPIWIEINDKLALLLGDQYEKTSK
jgi:hypothetical protein